MVYAHRQELVQLDRVVFSVVITLVILSCIAVSIRLWVRVKITKSPGWDDAVMIATLVLFNVYCYIILAMISRAAHGKLFKEQNRRTSIILIQLAEVFYILTTTTLRISLGLFFLRVLTKRRQTLIFHIILGVSAMYGVFYVFVTIFQCGNPINLADSFLDKNRCLPKVFILTTGYIYGILNVVADWTFVLIPIAILIDSDIDRRSKISVSIVMALGAIGSISSIFRLLYLEGLFLDGGVSPSSIKATIWATTEPGTGIIAASVAIWRPLFRKIASDVRDKVEVYQSRKASLPSLMLKAGTPAHDDTIALTAVISNPRDGKGTTMHSEHEDDPWSPTFTVSKASTQRVVNVQMVGGRAMPPPPPPRQ